VRMMRMRRPMAKSVLLLKTAPLQYAVDGRVAGGPLGGQATRVAFDGFGSEGGRLVSTCQGDMMLNEVVCRALLDDMLKAPGHCLEKRL
jgi:hypothetical protein